MNKSMPERAALPDAPISRPAGGLALVVGPAAPGRREAHGSRARSEPTHSVGTETLVASISDSLDEAVYLFHPVIERGHVVELSLAYANTAAHVQTCEPLVLGASIDEVFVDGRAALSCAESVWFGRSHSECRVTRMETIGGVRRAVSLVLRTMRLGDTIVQVTVDRADAIASSVDGPRRVLDDDAPAASDLAELSRQRTELRWLATHSPMTNLLNRSGFVRAADRLLTDAAEPYCLIWFELEELHVIRQTFGFAAGDAALSVAALRLRDLGETLGGIIGQPEDSALVAMIPSRGNIGLWPDAVLSLVDELARPCSAFGLSVMTGPSAGWAVGPDHGDDAETLLRHAKTASWTACRSNVPMLRWKPGLDADQAKRAALLGEFGWALANDELYLEFQPKFDAATQCLVGAEALVRWMHPDRGRIMPNDFIPAVEFSGFCRPFTLWVVRSALARWAEITAVRPGAKVAINVPVALLSDPDFVEALLAEVELGRTDPSHVQVEITERGLDGNIAQLRAGLNRLTACGISVALDDFGTGQSSLAFLRRLPIQEVKIDRSFIEHLDVDEANRAVVAACVAIARTGAQIVCAEGVETEAELATAVQLGCHAVQGFLTGRPMSIEALLAVAATSGR